MRYFKIVLACFGFIFTVVGITVGVMFLTGKFDKEVIQPGDIAFDITEKLTEDDFEVVLSTTTENVTEKDVTLSLTNQTEKDGYISDGVVTVPKVVKLGTPFVVQVNKTTYDGMDEEWNVGGTSVIRAKSTNPLIQEATPLTVEVDVPVHSLSVELVTTTGTKIGTVSASNVKGLMKTLSQEDQDNQVVELAVGSVVRLKPVFIPAKSAKTTKGEDRKVIFEIPTAWRGIHIDFVDGENDLIEILRQTTIEDIKINAYCFRTSADEYAAQSAGYSDEELITMMNANGISGESYQIFGTNQKITSFTSSTKSEYINLAINSPLTLLANGTADGAFDLGLAIASDAGVARLEDKIAVIKLYAYWKDSNDQWIDAGDKLTIVGQTSSNKSNGVRAKINKTDANLSSWKVIASETGTYKLVAKLSYEYYSSSSSTPTVINFEEEFTNILVSDPISSDVSWKSSLPAIKQLVVLDGETAAEKYYPTLNLSDYVDIKNSNATYKVVRFFAYSTEGVNLKDVLGCTLYDGNFAVPDSSETYEVFEIPNGILTVKDVGSFRIFFATVVSDYLGNPKIQNGQYVFESFSNTNTINVVKSLKSLDASMTVNQGEEGKEYNKNTDENTKDYIFHVRQQDENVFTLSLVVSDVEIFERDYADGKIHIDFLLGGEISNILTLSETPVIDYDNNRIDFLVSVKALPDNNQPTLECKITYDLDARLNQFVSNNGNKVQIKVLNGFAQTIYFDAVKDADPKNSAENPIQVEITFNAGSDNIATKIDYSITLNGQDLLLEDLSKVTINEEALNKTFTLSSSEPSIISVEDSLEEGAKLSILGATEDKDVVITATASDGSEISANLYFRVLKSRQITLEAKDPSVSDTEIVIYGYQGNSINFRSSFDAKAGDIDLNNLMEYNVAVDDKSKVMFEDDTLKIVSTFGRDASLQLYITSGFGYTKIIPIRIASCIGLTRDYENNDTGLDDADFISRGETVPTERGTRVYAEHQRDIMFVLKQEQPTSTNITVSIDDFELPKNGGIESISYNGGILSISFDAVDKMTEKTIIFKKSFSENDQYAFTFTMKFLVFPNVKVSLVSSVGTEENPASYNNGETVIYDSKNAENGLIQLERILGSSSISEHAVLEAKINGEWQALTSSEGQFILPSSYRATDGGFVEVRVTYDGYKLNPIKVYLNPFFDESVLLDTKLLYGGKLYVPFVASGDNSIALTDVAGVTYSIVNATSEQYIKIKSNKIEKLDRLYTTIITSEKLRIENNNGVTELPIIILPVKYPFVAYSQIENAQNEETYRTVDLKTVIESEDIFDTLEAGSDETIDLYEKILVDGIDEGGAIITIANGDGTTNSYVNFDKANLTLSANSVGKDKMIYVNVKCGAEFEEAYSFVYRLKITANQQIKVFYPYIEYVEDNYDVSDAYEYLYFGSKNQVSVDLLEEFEADKTPNKAILEALFGKSFAKRFVVVREKDETLIPIDNKDLHFEIASVGIGSTVVPADKVSNYATITEKTSTSGALESAQLFINKGLATETIHVTIRAYTTSGAEAYYRFRVGSEPVSYKVYYKDKRVTSDEFSVASNGSNEINLNENVLVKVDENPEQIVSSNAYKFHLIVHEKLGTDYSQFITLNGGIIQLETLVNDVETTVVIYNAAGEIAKFNLVLKCTIDHEVKTSTVGEKGTYDIGESVEFFNASKSEVMYSMQEIDTTLYVRDYTNNSLDGDLQENNLYKYIGGYSIEDISKDYNQYVLLDNMKVYSENLVDTWGGKFYVGEEAKYEVKSDAGKEYIYYNGNVIDVEGEDEDRIVKIPLTTISDLGNVIEYKVKTEGSKSYVIIPHFSFSKGNDTRDFVLFDYVEYFDENQGADYLPFNTEAQTGEKSHETYVYEYINGKYVRYRVEVTKKGENNFEFKVAMLRVTHNDVQYIAEVDKDHNDDEYILINEEKHYFTRFYKITFEGLAEEALDKSNNIPYVRYVVDNSAFNSERITIDMSKILFFMQGTEDKILKLNGDEYVDGMFTFSIGGNPVDFDVEGEGEETKKTTNITVDRANEITITVKDTTGNFVVGRLIVVPTVATSSSTSTNNQTIFIEAGSNDVNYKIEFDTISVAEYAASMSGSFSGDIDTDHEGWSNYVYSVSSEKYSDIKIENNGENDGKISNLKDQQAWGDITVGAKLQYSREEITLMYEILYETWAKQIFGESYPTYGELRNNGIFAQLLCGKNEIGQIDDNGKIKVPYGNYNLTITLGKACTCGKFVELGKTDNHIHEHELKEEPSATYNSLDELVDYSSYFGILNSLKSVIIPTKGQIVLTGNLSQEDDGKWTLSEDGKIELYEFGKEVEFTAVNSIEMTNTKTFTLDETKTITLPEGATNPSITTEGVNGTYDSDSRTYIFGESVAEGTEIKISYTYTFVSGNISTEYTIKQYDISTNFKDLFPSAIIEYVFTGVDPDDQTWNTFLEKCTVEVNGSEFTDGALGDGTTTSFNFVITTQTAAHTGTFYIVNQEIVETKAHRKGNLSKIDGIAEAGDPVTINTATVGKEIVLKATEVDGKFVLPMSTKKILTDDSITAINAKIREWWFKDLEGETNIWSYSQDLNNPLGTAAGLVAGNDPFNTITIYQQGYAIGNLHIYLEDYSGDLSYEKYSTYQTTNAIKENEKISTTLSGASSDISEPTLTLEINVNGANAWLTARIEAFELDATTESLAIDDEEIKAFTPEEMVALSNKDEVVKIIDNKKYVYALSEGSSLSSQTDEENNTTWTLSEGGKITKTTYERGESDKKITTYIIQNALMENNQYLLGDGLQITFDKDNNQIVLQVIGKDTDKDIEEGEYYAVEFVVGDYTFVLNSETKNSVGKREFNAETNEYETTFSYFEGLKDTKKQPESDDKEDGEKVYKAEKTGDDKNDKDVVYKDRIVENDFNFENWEYITSFKDASDATHSSQGKEVVIDNLGDDKQLKIIVKGIQDGNGQDYGDYVFVVDLSERSIVNIIVGGGETATSPSTPINGGAIAAGQQKDLAMSEIFKIGLTSREIVIDNFGGNDTDDQTIINELFKAGYLAYLKGVVKDGDTVISSSTIFRVTTNDEGQTTTSIVFKINRKDVVYELTLGDKEVEFQFAENEGEENSEDGYTYSIVLNKDMYEFSAIQESGEGSAEPAPHGEQGETSKEGEGTEEGTEEGGEESSTKKLVITVTPIFTYKYSIENNSLAVKVTEKGDFATSGKLTLTGNAVNVSTEVKFKFTVLRGQGNDTKEEGDDAKEVGYAYYSITVKPSFVANINYPSMKFAGEEEKSIQSTEYFYADAGVFDVTKASEFSLDTAGRIDVEKHAYGTATYVDETGKKQTISCEVIYSDADENITVEQYKIGSDGEFIARTATLSGSGNTYSTEIDGYNISVFIPSLNIQYTATSNYAIIKNVNENTLGNTKENQSGKFEFEFTDVKVSEAVVTISVQAKSSDGAIYTFGQYEVVVCKNPVVTARITTDPTHMDANGNEIIPVDGSSSALKPFDVSDEKSFGYVNGTPRLQFVYDNKVLSGVYLNNFMADGNKVGEYTISQTDGDADEKTILFKFKEQDVEQDVSGSYKYVTKWDYKLNPTELNSHTIEGIQDPANSSELLNYYYLDAGKTYDIVDTFGITKLFGDKFDTNEFTAEFVTDSGEFVEAGADVKKCVTFTKDGKGITISGAPNGGLSFQIKIYPYGESGPRKTLGITILPTINIKVNYQAETNFENDSYIYGLISADVGKSAYEYILVNKYKSPDFSIERDGVVSNIDARYTFTLEKDMCDDINATVSGEIQSGELKLTISDPPQLNAKRIVIKVADEYGYFEYLRYVVAAKTQVDISSNDISFTTGGEIEWTEEQPFPISFKKSTEETNQLASFYTASLDGATATTNKNNNLITNVSDSYGSNTSLKAASGKLYGVQLDSVITAKKWNVDEPEDTSNKNIVDTEDGNYLLVYSATEMSYKENGESFIVTDTEENEHRYTLNAENLIYDEYVSEIQTKDGKTFFTIGTTDYQIEGGKFKVGETEYLVSDGEFTIGKTRYIIDGNEIYEPKNMKASGGRYTLKDGSYAVKLTNKQYIPYLEAADSDPSPTIAYDVYKLASVTETIQKSFDKYESHIIYNGSTSEPQLNGENGALIVKDAIQGKPYVIELYKKGSSTPEAIIVFEALKATKRDVLYYAERLDAQQGYTFSYSIKIDGTDIVDEGDGKTIKNVGNGQYGSATSINTTLVITVKDYSASGVEKIIDTVDVSMALLFGIHPEITQTVSGVTSFDYVGLGDNIYTILEQKKKAIKLIDDSGSVSTTPKYYKVLGDDTSSSSEITTTGTKAEAMVSGELSKSVFAYNPTTRMLTRKEAFTSNQATINNILYTYNSSSNTLKIGYKEVKLTDGEYVDEATGITYAVKDGELQISKKVNASGVATINNIEYTVADTTSKDTTVTYTTLYESVYVVWTYNSLTYWAQWNYKVVDKYNAVTTNDSLEAQDGTIHVNFDWTSGDYRFNANTLKLFNGEKELGTATWKSSTSGESGYYIELDGTEYQIVIDNNEMKFKNSSGAYKVDGNDLALTEETTVNTSWADKIQLTGLDGSTTSLKSAGSDIKVLVDQADVTEWKIGDANNKNAIDTNKSYSISIVYLSKISDDNLTPDDNGKYHKKLLYNGNEVKVVFGHFNPNSSK